MIHLYIGNGKGKTSVALGICLRAAGFGKKVYIAQFLKSGRVPCGEMNAIKKWLRPIVTIERFSHQEHPFFLKERPFNKDLFLASLDESMTKVHALLRSKRYAIMVLDEVLDVVQQKFMPEERLISLMKDSAHVELILTGRAASKRIQRLAAYVSTIRKIKHPFDRGVTARKGIEY